MSRRVHLVNSPFDFGEVGKNFTDRLCRQEKGYYNADETVFTFHDSFTKGLLNKEYETRAWNAAVDPNMRGRRWAKRNSGRIPMEGAPECPVRQLVAFPDNLIKIEEEQETVEA